MREYPRRFVRVPCFNSERWNEQEDLTAQGDSETTVFLSTATLVSLLIKGVDEMTWLAIKEDADGHPVSCAVVDDNVLETFQRVQSNPRRHEDEGDCR